MLSDLTSGFLMRRVTPLAAELFRETTPQDPQQRRSGKKTRALRPDEEYVKNALISAGELLTSCEQLAYAVEFLSGFRARKMPSGEPITRLDYIVYHLENHLIRTGSVLDRALLLANVVFALGTPERECRFEVIVDNSHVKPTPVAAALKSIEKTIEPYRHPRNLVVHRRRLTEEALDSIETYYALQKSAVTGPADDVVASFFYFSKAETDQFVASKKEELTRLNKQIFSAVSDLFGALEPIFDHKHTSLRGVL